MPRIMQKSQKPLMRKALTAVRFDSLAADGDQPVEGHQQAFPEEDQGDEIIGENGAVGQGGREEDIGVVLADARVVLHLDGRVEGDQEQEAGRGRGG